MPILRPMTFAPDSLSKGEREQLGRLVAWWGYVEYQAMVIVRVCCEKMTKEDMWLILVGAEVNALSSMLRTIAFSDHWIQDKTLRDRIGAFAGTLQNNAEKRNNHIHAVYGHVNNNVKKRVRHSFKPKGHRATPSFELVSAASLKRMANEAQALWQTAQNLSDDLKAYMAKRKASRGK